MRPKHRSNVLLLCFLILSSGNRYEFSSGAMKLDDSKMKIMYFNIFELKDSSIYEEPFCFRAYLNTASGASEVHLVQHSFNQRAFVQ